MGKMRNRAELILSLLYANESIPKPIVGMTRLEKMIFLLTKQESVLSDVKDEKYTFVPFRMGPWSNEVYDEIDFLESLGLVKKRNSHSIEPAEKAETKELFNTLIIEKYQRNVVNTQQVSEILGLTEKGIEKAKSLWNRLNDEEKKKIVNIKNTYNNMNLRQLLRYIYNKYPEYTTESEIKEYLEIG